MHLLFMVGFYASSKAKIQQNIKELLTFFYHITTKLMEMAVSAIHKIYLINKKRWHVFQVRRI